MRKRITLLLVAAMIAALTVAMSASPAFADGGKKPECVPPTPTEGKLGVCHRTGSASNPFVEITPSCNSLVAHNPLHHDPTGNAGVSDIVDTSRC